MKKEDSCLRTFEIKINLTELCKEQKNNLFSKRKSKVHEAFNFTLKESHISYTLQWDNQRKNHFILFLLTEIYRNTFVLGDRSQFPIDIKYVNPAFYLIFVKNVQRVVKEQHLERCVFFSFKRVNRYYENWNVYFQDYNQNTIGSYPLSMF